MCPALVPHQQRIALREIPCIFCPAVDLYQASVTVLRFSSGDAFGDDGAFGVFTQMDHFGPRICLLKIVGHRDGIKLSYRIVSFQYARRIFPRHSRTGLYLRPGNFCIGLANPSFSHKIKNPSLTFFVSGKPVLNRGIFDFCIVHRNQFNHCCMQLVFITSRCCTSFQVTHITTFVSNDQSPFKLSCSSLIDSKIRGQFHRTFDSFGNVTKRTVRKNSGVQSRIKIVCFGNDCPHVFFDQFRVLLNGFRNGTENNAFFCQGLFKSGRYRHRINNDVYGNTLQFFLLVNGNPQFFIHFQQFCIYIVQTLVGVCFFGCRIVTDGLKIGFFITDIRPLRFFHFLPDSKSVQTPIGHPLRFVFLL